MSNTPKLIQAIHSDSKPPLSRRKLVIKLSVITTAIVLAGYALFRPIELVVSMPAQVVPSGRVKTIQHLEGGIVSDLHVKEGQAVTAGQALVDIDLGVQGPNLEELRAKEAALKAAKIRLTAEASGTSLTRKSFPDELPTEVVASELTTYQARVLEQSGAIAGAQASVAGARARTQEAAVKVQGLKSRLSVLEKENDVNAKLAAEKLIPLKESLSTQKELELVRAEIQLANQTGNSAQVQILEAQAKLSEAEGRFRRRAAEELLAIDRSLATAAEELRRAQDQRNRTNVTSPIEGVVKGLRSTGSGWVVKAGEPLMDIVPQGAGIQIEAKMSPSDRGLVMQGQPVNIKVTAYDYLRYGSLRGTVMQIAADSDTDPQAGSYFRVTIDPYSTSLKEGRYAVTSGMQANVDVVVGKQPFIWAFIRPLLKTTSESFKEP